MKRMAGVEMDGAEVTEVEVTEVEALLVAKVDNLSHAALVEQRREEPRTRRLCAAGLGPSRAALAGGPCASRGVLRVDGRAVGGTLQKSSTSAENSHSERVPPPPERAAGRNAPAVQSTLARRAFSRSRVNGWKRLRLN